MIEIKKYDQKQEKNFKMCYKKVSSDDITYNKKFNEKNKNAVLNVLNSFKLSEQTSFDELKMKNNSKIFIEKLFKGSDEEFIKLLLNDFSEEMNTKMREKDKYVILILFENTLILAHSKIGEKSINTNFTVFDRLLDKDNVMRVVFFEKKENQISVSHYEKNKSKFFIKWLGLPQKDLFYKFGGENKFYSEIQGFSLVLEISDEDIDTINNNEYISIEDNLIKFSQGVNTLKINHIMRQNKRYNTYYNFEKDFISRKYGLMSYKEEYKKIKNNLKPIMETIYDCESEIKGENYSLKKNDKINILFCNDQINIDEDYLNKLLSLLLNDEPTRLVHVGEKINQTPISIGNFKIFNELKLDLSENLIYFLNENNHPKNFRKELLYTIFSCLKYDNPKSDMNYFFDKLLKKLIKEFEFNSVVVENNVLELKSEEYFIGSDKKIIEKLYKDIERKLKKDNFKLYIIGYDEKTRKYEPFSAHPFGDDRINNIQKELKNRLNISNLNITKIPTDKYNCIIMISVKK